MFQWHRHGFFSNFHLQTFWKEKGMTAPRPFLMAALAGFLFLGCKDAGTNGVPDDPPVISGLSATTVAVGDTFTVSGSNFGAIQGESLLFLNECSTPVVASWSDGQIRVLTPNIGATISVRVQVGGRESNSVGLGISNYVTGDVSYACDIRPILNFGCAISGCHVGPSPQSQFDQSTYSGLRAGGVKFGANVIKPADSSGSEIIRAMRGTASGGLARMPLGGPWVNTGVPDSLINRVALWIQQGAKLN